MEKMIEPTTKFTKRGSFFVVALAAIRREIALRKQYTFVYCPNCNFELTQMNNAIDEADGMVFHVCKNCGAGTRWNCDMPAPINVT
jgi:predicted RNA-binding Zn-ribbon protein involved in translation (DUF1610 family)